MKIDKDESNHTNKKTSIEFDLDSYRKAAICDDYLFGDYNYDESWIGITTSDV